MAVPEAAPSCGTLWLCGTLHRAAAGVVTWLRAPKLTDLAAAFRSALPRSSEPTVCKRTWTAT